MAGKTALVLFTRDLRVTDNPALWAASRAERTVPLFVLDEAILGSPFAAAERGRLHARGADRPRRQAEGDGRAALPPPRPGGRGGDRGGARVRRRRVPHR